MAATLMRELGHEFVGRVLDDQQLERLSVDIRALLDVVRDYTIAAMMQGAYDVAVHA